MPRRKAQAHPPLPLTTAARCRHRRPQGLLDNPWLKSGIISGSLSLAGDVLAQLISLRGRQQQVRRQREMRVAWTEGGRCLPPSVHNEARSLHATVSRGN